MEVLGLRRLVVIGILVVSVFAATVARAENGSIWPTGGRMVSVGR